MTPRSYGALHGKLTGRDIFIAYAFLEKTVSSSKLCANVFQ